MGDLIIISRESGEQVHRIDTTGKTEGQIARIESGMSINFERFYWVEEMDAPVTPGGQKDA